MMTPRIQELYDLAMENLNLPAYVPMTIGDLIALAGDDSLHEDETFHALLLALFRTLGDGSVCLFLEHKSLCSALDFLPDDLASELAGKIMTRWQDFVNLPRIISNGDGPPTPLVYQDRDQTHPVLYFQRYHRAEERLKGVLDGLLRQPRRTVTPQMVEAFRLATEGGDRHQLAPEQRLAVALALCQSFLVISGGPGTGKTTIILAILKALMHLGVAPGRIRLAAPTGRAANRMAESIRIGLDQGQQIEASTVHRLLGFNPRTGRFLHDGDHPLDLDVLVIDEASMVDISLMANVLGAMPSGARVILLGDRDQLPSVDPGALLSDLLTSGGGDGYTKDLANDLAPFDGLDPGDPTDHPTRMSDHLVLLTKTHRFSGEMEGLARRVIRGDVTVIDDLRDGESGFLFKPIDGQSPVKMLHNDVMEWFDYFYLQVREDGTSYIRLVESFQMEGHHHLPAIFRHLAGNRILTLTRHGPTGVSGINRVFIRLFETFLSDSFLRGDGPPSGTPILITRNDHTRKLYNGDTGVILKDGNGLHRAWFEISGGHVSWPVDELTDLEPAFAITVHKAQGSEYDNILVVLPENEDHRLLTREIVYTALTRARVSGTIIGSTGALQLAISRRIHRHSTMKEWMAR